MFEARGRDRERGDDDVEVELRRVSVRREATDPQLRAGGDRTRGVCVSSRDNAVVIFVEGSRGRLTPMYTTDFLSDPETYRGSDVLNE